MAEPKPQDSEKPGERNPAFERFEDLAKRLLHVPKEEAAEKRRERERARDEKRGG